MSPKGYHCFLDVIAATGFHDRKPKRTDMPLGARWSTVRNLARIDYVARTFARSHWAAAVGNSHWGRGSRPDHGKLGRTEIRRRSSVNGDIVQRSRDPLVSVKLMSPVGGS
ncbi:hypothetical protein GCM10011610_56520 [Nocardia rhizosphaerihabitans]|uniref:Uncharacterized protein n=1 Tax=Nocardia rhizosphaerihabitans TaxID=1691570 RepID=A0ABQ2KVH3_9NOCA|nr:hypothetical protein GCM10011610_56520 [Nocardia rhizosphaerihabitans]